MASLWFYFTVRDNSTVGLGARISGLSPTWSLFKSLNTNADIAPQPVIIEVGLGIYKYAYDAEQFGDSAGQVDALGGANPLGVVLIAADRYIDTFATREPSRLLSGVNPSGQVRLAPEGLDAVPIETGINARQALAPILAASAGVVVGKGTGTIVFKGGNVTDTRITATTDTAGNWTAVALSLPPASLRQPASNASLVNCFFPSDYYPKDYFPFGRSFQG